MQNKLRNLPGTGNLGIEIDNPTAALRTAIEFESDILTRAKRYGSFHIFRHSLFIDTSGSKKEGKKGYQQRDNAK